MNNKGLALIYLLLPITIIVLTLISAAVVARQTHPPAPPTNNTRPSTTLPTPTPTSSPTTPQPSLVNSLPPSCQQDFRAEACQKEMQDLAKKICQADFETSVCVGDECQSAEEVDEITSPEAQKALDCANDLYRPLTAFACQKDPSSAECQCQKDEDPYVCVVIEPFAAQLKNLDKTLLCPLEQEFAKVGISLFPNLDCSGDYPGKPTTTPEPPLPNCQINPYAAGCETFFEYACLFNPETPGCEEYAATVCIDDPYAPGCTDYCLQNPDSEACLMFLAQYCPYAITDDVCMNFLCERAPNLCNFCSQYPNACEQILQRYF